MNLTPKQLSIILSGLIILLVASGLVGFGIAHQTLSDKADRLSILLADISVSNERLNSLQQLEQEYADMTDLREKTNKILPEGKRQTEVSLQLQKIIDDAGLELNSLSFESTSGSPGEVSQTLTSSVAGVRIMPVRFQITSSYQEFVELLISIENHQRHMQVSNLNISRSGDSLSFSINLEVFLKP
ncbi:MAG: type 4a pilus biogenesis protein PilO [Candidatus Saccharimonadales bacterium]